MRDATHHTHADKSHCRICQAHVDHNAPHYPFCSEKCKQVDLGRWATGKYAVSRPATEDDLQTAGGVAEKV